METLSIAANGQRLHALAAGPVDGPLVVLLHGFPESSQSWTALVASLAAAGHRVVAPDQRGIGRSSKPAGRRAYGLDALGRDIVALVRALGRERASVVGHDWGGAVAWQLALHHADVLERVVILNAPHPAAFTSWLLRHPSQLRKSWYMAFFQLPWLPEALLRARDFERLAHSLASTSRPGTFTARDLATCRAEWAQPGALTGMLNWYRALAFAPRLPAGGRRVDVPLQLLWGDRDRFLEAGMADASIAHCTHGNLVHLPDATHWLQHEQPARIAELVLAFLSAPTTGSRR